MTLLFGFSGFCTSALGLAEAPLGL